MSARNLTNSCGGQGCDVPEHEKRTGTDDLTVVVKVDILNKVIYVNDNVQIGALVEILENIFDDEWPEVEIRRSPSNIITWTTTIAN